MKTRGPILKQSTLTRALKAAVAAGLPPRKAFITPDGGIELDFAAGTLEVHAKNDWDEILKGRGDEAA